METNSPVSEKAGRFTSLRAACEALSLSKRKIATGAAAVLALGVGYHVVCGANGLTAFERKRVQTQDLNQEMMVLQHENDRLKDHVQRLQTDPSAIEQQAREQLRYTKPNEIIYTLPTK
jgi:cell division protein FtsB